MILFRKIYRNKEQFTRTREGSMDKFVYPCAGGSYFVANFPRGRHVLTVAMRYP